MTRGLLKRKGEISWYSLAGLALVIAILSVFVSALLDQTATLSTASPWLMTITTLMFALQLVFLAYRLVMSILTMIRSFMIRIFVFKQDTFEIDLSDNHSNPREAPLPLRIIIKKLSVIRC